MNAGVGSSEQQEERAYLKGWSAIGGIAWAKGMNKNVEDSVEFVRGHCKRRHASNMRVNMAGHSRGSMTALKIAHRLQEEDDTKGCEVNLFLIDPVPGNLGWVNSGMYKKIAMEGNVREAYMFLAESERRNAFKPYIDKKFLQNQPAYRMDSIPGNHGGINQLANQGRHDSGYVVLHHAVTFLAEHGTAFNDSTLGTKSPVDLLEHYAAIMLDFQGYKSQGHKRSEGNVVFHVLAGGVTKGDRKVQVHNPQKFAGPLNVPNLEKNQFDSKPMVGLGTRVEALSGLSRETRFFANYDHKRLFRENLAAASAHIEQIELHNDKETRAAMFKDPAFLACHKGMGNLARHHVTKWLEKICAA